MFLFAKFLGTQFIAQLKQMTEKIFFFISVEAHRCHVTTCNKFSHLHFCIFT